MFLLVRNVLPVGKPAELVKKAIAEISAADDGKELSEITADVMPGGCPQDPHSSCTSVLMGTGPSPHVAGLFFVF